MVCGRVIRNVTVGLAAGLILLLGQSPARAQTSATGTGIKLGQRLVFHPALSTEVRYDSNVFYEPESRGGTHGSAALRLSPSVGIATRPGIATVRPTVEFRLSAGLDYTEYLNPDT